MGRAEFAAWVAATGGVATRAELEAVGVSSATIASRIANGEWQRPFRGVFLLFPGVPSWEQRLACIEKWLAGKGVFSHQTAAYLHGLRRDPPEVLDVAVGPTVGIRSTDKCRVWRTVVPLTRVGSPSRTSLEQTVVDLVDTAPSESVVLDLLTTAIQRRMSLPRFLKELGRHRRVRHRGFVMRVTEIADEGVESHLELAYRQRVERAHGLPRAVRQRWERIRGRWMRSDCWYPEYAVRAELDGELAHPGRATDADLMRDNDVRIALNEITVRYRWTHVWNAPCVAAAQVAAALQRRGWRGMPKKCSPECAVLDTVAGYLG
jgi:hypothetical protein